MIMEVESIVGEKALKTLNENGYVIVRPYDKIWVEGEGDTQLYTLVPQSQIDGLETVIRILKGERG
jgi:hypothetical protein